MVFFLAACDGGGGDPVTTGAPGTTTPPTTEVEGEVLAYEFEAGDTHTYSVSLTQHIVLSSEGSSEAVGEEGIPGEMDVTIAADGTFEYAVSAGPTPETYSLAIDGTFANVEVSGTVDGEAADDPSDLEGLGAIQPVSTVVVVDSQGRVTSDPNSPTASIGLGATPLTGLGGDLSRWVGPVLSADPVTVGSTWTETSVDESIGDEPVETTLTATITGTEAGDGFETFVIATDTATGQADIDLTEFFAGFLGAFNDPDDPDAQAELEEMLDQLVFRITIEPSTSEGTSWFDPGAGLARRSVVDGSPTRFRMDVRVPDEETGELESFTMDLEVTQSLEYVLDG